MNVPAARTLFERTAVKVGLKVAGMSSAASSPTWTSRALGQRSELRLSWKASEERLALEISHGSDSGSHAGWLLIFEVQCTGGNVPDAKDNERSFESAVAYAMELMAPGSCRDA